MTKPEQASVAALAYLGDSVIEVMVRTRLVESGISSSGALNRAALSYVRASAQSGAADRILPLLSETEAAVFRRARNNSTAAVPHSATVRQYRYATGLEALFGYLHLCGSTERLDELFRAAYDGAENDDGAGAENSDNADKSGKPGADGTGETEKP